jgi:hypothetical protein
LIFQYGVPHSWDGFLAVRVIARQILPAVCRAEGKRGEIYLSIAKERVISSYMSKMALDVVNK